MHRPGIVVLGLPALIVLPLLGIGLAARTAAPSQQSATAVSVGTPCTAAGDSTAGCGQPKAGPCCARWLPSSLTQETDALAADPHNQGRLFAGTPAGVWISSDLGRSWHVDRGWPADVPALSFATGPGTDALFAGSGTGAVFARDPGMPWAWRRISPSLGGNPIYSLSFNASSRVLLAGTVGALYRGTFKDGRWAWRAVLHTGYAAISAIAWVPGRPQEAFASIFGSTPPVVGTHDGGRTWLADPRGGLPAVLPAQSMIPVGPGGQQMLFSTMGNGVWLRSPHGWRDVSAGLPEHHAMPLLSGPDGTIYAGTMGYGVYAAAPSLAVWRRLGRELADVDHIVLSLSIGNGAAPVLLAGTASGVFRYPL